jgi:DNA polymerase V
MRVNSDAMFDAGIYNGDVVIVDRSLEAKNGKVIIAVLNGEMLIRRLEIFEGKKKLLPATKKLSAIEISDDNTFSVWGVVTFVIHRL